MPTTVASRRRARVLYAGVAAFAVLAALTARSIWAAWQARSGEARAEAIYELVGQRTAPRPMDAPGAMAWLRLELDRFARRLDTERARIYRSLAAARESVPDELRGVRAAMEPEAPPQSPARIIDLQLVESSQAATSLRRQWRIDFDGRPFIVTRRRPPDAAPADGAAGADAFIAQVLPRLSGISRRLGSELAARPLAALPAGGPPRPVRVYAVSTDGTLVSAPSTNEDATADAAAARELALLATRPGLPSFAPEEFFFRFDPGRGPAGRTAYSGFYLDLGGRGLVSTLITPLNVDASLVGVIAIDLAFDIDWQAFAASVEPPISGVALDVPDAGGASWPAFERSLPRGASAGLTDAVAELAARERQAMGAGDQAPLRHGLVDGRGAVAAFQVADSVWLLMLFPRTSLAFPIAAMAMLAALLAVLLAGFELNRRRADDERRTAERALAEKQNLLNTMQVPLVVVDPNTDAIVSSNRAAETIGIRAGGRFADLVAADPGARAHYEKMQVATSEPRRAYGVPVVVRDERGRASERYAVVRSVAVTAPIEALAADERHRLGILFLLDPDADLALLRADLERHAHGDERRRLAGLLSHGVDTLARVLEHSLTRPAAGPHGGEFTAWLAEYLERRLAVTAWLLDHWDAPAPPARDHVVDRGQARATVERLRSILVHVRDDRILRSRLHWDNGTLSAPAPDGRVLDVRCDWPAAFEFALPVRGGFGLFMSEVIANAVRHGTAGTVPRVSIVCDPVRRELAISVRNQCAPSASDAIRGEAYGGVAILQTLARLFEWRDLRFSRTADRFETSWQVPVTQRATVEEAD